MPRRKALSICLHGCRRGDRSRRRKFVPVSESLEPRTVMSGTSVSVGVAAAALNPRSRYNHVEQYRQKPQAARGTISGIVTNAVTGKAIARIQVQLLDSNGDVVETKRTNARGAYTFKVKTDGAYVVREVTPKQFSQTSPTFAYTAPKGCLAPGAGNNSWSYDTGNSKPAFGPVGAYTGIRSRPPGTSRSSHRSTSQ